MIETIPITGLADETLRRQAHLEWLAAASQAGLDLDGFDPDTPFEQRVAWAIRPACCSPACTPGSAPSTNTRPPTRSGRMPSSPPATTCTSRPS
jgi:hypothetical protein